MLGAIIKFVIMFLIILFVMRVFFKLMYPSPPKHMVNKTAKRSNHTDSGSEHIGSHGGKSHASTSGAHPDSVLPKQVELKPCVVCNKVVADSIAIKKGEHVFCSAKHLTEFYKEIDAS